MQAVNEYVIVAEHKEEEAKSQGGIVMPDFEAPPIKKGTVQHSSVDWLDKGDVIVYPIGRSTELTGGLHAVDSDVIMVIE